MAELVYLTDPRTGGEYLVIITDPDFERDLKEDGDLVIQDRVDLGSKNLILWPTDRLMSQD